VVHNAPKKVLAGHLHRNISAISTERVKRGWYLAYQVDRNLIFCAPIHDAERKVGRIYLIVNAG